MDKASASDHKIPGSSSGGVVVNFKIIKESSVLTKT